MQNINVFGTFQEYMESVVEWVREQVGSEYKVEDESTHWLEDQPAHVIKLFGITEPYNSHFSIAKFEFDRNESKGRNSLAIMRFNDCMYGIKYLKEKREEIVI